MNFRLLLILFLINNLLHYISEKSIIVTFILVFYFLVKILGNLIEEDYIQRVNIIKKDIDNYTSTVFDMLRYYKSFFRRLSDFRYDFGLVIIKLKGYIKKALLLSYLKSSLLSITCVNLNNNKYLSTGLFK